MKMFLQKNHYRFLVVESESTKSPTCQPMLKQLLRAEGFAVEVVRDAQLLERRFSVTTPSFIIVNLASLRCDELALCRHIRQQTLAPILVLTDSATDVEKAIGLEVGADGYMTAPISAVELVAQIKALLRRTYLYDESLCREKMQPVSLLGDRRLTMDLSSHIVKLNGQELDLTPIEFRLLEILMSNPGRVISRNRLLTQVWGCDDNISENIVTVHIGNLRRKLGRDGSAFIQTVRSVGYVYRAH